MNDTKYNGWANYETWNYALWLDNDQGSYSYWRERAQEFYDETQPGQDREQKPDLAEPG